MCVCWALRFEVQYCVDVVSIISLEQHGPLNYKTNYCLANILQYTYMRINSATAAIFMTSLSTLDANLR